MITLRNFRKKILGMGILDKTNEKDKSTSKKGAFLYSFNKEAYDEVKNMMNKNNIKMTVGELQSVAA